MLVSCGYARYAAAGTRHKVAGRHVLVSLNKRDGVLQRESFLLHMLFVGALSMPGLRQQHCKAFVCGALRALMRILVDLQDVGGACVCLHVCYVL